MAYRLGKTCSRVKTKFFESRILSSGYIKNILRIYVKIWGRSGPRLHGSSPWNGYCVYSSYLYDYTPIYISVLLWSIHSPAFIYGSPHKSERLPRNRMKFKDIKFSIHIIWGVNFKTMHKDGIYSMLQFYESLYSTLNLPNFCDHRCKCTTLLRCVHVHRNTHTRAIPKERADPSNLRVLFRRDK